MKLPTLAKPVMRKVCTVKIETGISQSNCNERCAPISGSAWNLCMAMCKVEEAKGRT